MVVVLCWGHNGYGQLGDGTGATQRRPTPVESIETAVSIDSGEYNSCAVLVSGEVSCWGKK